MAVYTEDLLWGCLQMNFKANPPFNEMTQGFASFKKEARMAQIFSRTFLEVTITLKNFIASLLR
jgi:hypothetical protein